jgi:D-arginine dehydrogenase
MMTEMADGTGQYADIAIVGAGIIGCLVAREAASRAPGASIVVLDRGAIGSSASLLSAGLQCPRGSSEGVRAMAEFSLDYYAELRDAQPSLPIRPVGMSVVAAESAASAVHGAYLERARLARKDKLVETDGLARGAVRIPPGTAVWSGDGCDYADVGMLARDIARVLRPRVAFREAVAVKAVELVASGVVLRLGIGESLTAAAVVLAPGPWLACPAWRDYASSLGARVKKIVSLHIDRQPTDADDVVVFHDEDAFLLPLHRQGYWLFSYTCHDWDVAPDDLADGLSGRDLQEGCRALRRWSPELADRVIGGRVFCDAYSGDGEPIVAALVPDGRLVFAGAANGSGYRLAPAIARQAIDLLRPADRIKERWPDGPRPTTRLS